MSEHTHEPGTPNPLANADRSAEEIVAEVAPKDLVSVSDLLPPNLVLVPVAQTTMFPGMIVPVILPEGDLSQSVDDAIEKSGYLGVVLPKYADQTKVATGPNTSMTGVPLSGLKRSKRKRGRNGSSNGSTNGNGVHGAEKATEFYEYGVVAKVLKRINLPDNQISVLLSGVQRFRVDKILTRDPSVVAGVHYLYDELDRSDEFEALLRSAVSQFKKLSKDNPLISEEMKVALVNVDGPSKLADLMASVLINDVENYQKFLGAFDVNQRLQHLLMLLKKETDIQGVQKKIHEEINQKVATSQREFYLHEQLKAIQKELGQTTDERSRLRKKFKDRLKGKKLSKEVEERIKEEFEKFESLHEQSSEYSVTLNYLDWATSLPWNTRSEDNFELRSAKKTLDKAHYGLKDVKERILEFLSVRKLKKNSEGSIICLVGPPGTGKTSVGRSIAEAVGRKFFRFSVGGMRDEAEIKGHRRTYVGAMPGKVVQGLKRMGTQNPVFMIDEVDKLGNGWASGGDPASALLEVLDPEQNKEFLDHYLDLPFDCSEVMFITTANTTDTIPSALLDRMEVIPIYGYSDNEKFEIAKRYLIPKQLEKNGLKPNQLKLSDAALRDVISLYARESGVRNLEMQIARLCRKVAYKLATGGARAQLGPISDKKTLEKLLGQPPYQPEISPHRLPGVVTGLAWTQYGGEVLFIESTSVEGKDGFMLTGSLGDVMQESARIAYTYIRSHAKKLDLPKDFWEKNQFHLHVPAGATPKDGPSAGVTMAASLYSLFSKKVAQPDVAMTGELTLSGRVLPVGGIKEKLLAAKRTGIKKVLIPKDNGRDLREIEPGAKKGLKIVKVANMTDVLRHLF